MEKVTDWTLLFYQGFEIASSTSSCPPATQGLSCIVQSFFPQTPNLFPAKKKKKETFKLGYLEGIGQCGRPLALLVLVGWGRENARVIQKGRVLQPDLPWEEL